MAFIPFLLSLITVIIIGTANKSSQNLVIYVDPMNGTTDINCWTSGLEQPCQNLEIALEGAKQIKDSAIMTLQPTSIQSNKPLVERVDTDDCPTWMNFNVASNRCECGKSIHGIVRCKRSLHFGLLPDDI